MMSGWFGGIYLSDITVHVTPAAGGAVWNGSVVLVDGRDQGARQELLGIP